MNFRERLVEAGTHGQRSASDLILGIRQRLKRASVPQHVSRSEAGDRLLLHEKTHICLTGVAAGARKNKWTSTSWWGLDTELMTVLNFLKIKGGCVFACAVDMCREHES